jgi:hypothetical protein
MLKNISQLEHVIGDKVFRFICEADAAIPHIKEALFQFAKFVGQIEEQIQAAQNAQPPAPVEPPAPAVEPEQPKVDGQ